MHHPSLERQQSGKLKGRLRKLKYNSADWRESSAVGKRRTLNSRSLDHSGHVGTSDRVWPMIGSDVLLTFPASKQVVVVRTSAD